VPTNQATVEAMLRIANVGPEDFVIDLGSGDGRILITAARLYGARGFGVDLDPQRVNESVENARRDGRLVYLRDERLEGERLRFVLIDDVDFCLNFVQSGPERVNSRSFAHDPKLAHRVIHTNCGLF
jgi:ribosomal protein L11 methylase PrmA